MPRRPSVLVIDGDPAMRLYLRRRLTASGYAVDEMHDGASAIRRIAEAPPDAVILATDLPHCDTMALVRTLREASLVPLLALLPAISERGLVDALDSGADDCLAKPFALGELMARVRKMLRHAAEERGCVTLFVSGNLEVDLVRQTVRVHGRDVKLSRHQMHVLSLLVRADGAILAYRDILDQVWGADYGGRVQYLRRTISHLRRKIEPDPRSPVYITNDARVGYRLVRGLPASRRPGQNAATDRRTVE
jgi:two-component system, OmpR family, KDP operon response regulator KdpE